MRFLKDLIKKSKKDKKIQDLAKTAYKAHKEENSKMLFKTLRALKRALEEARDKELKAEFASKVNRALSTLINFNKKKAEEKRRNLLRRLSQVLLEFSKQIQKNFEKSKKGLQKTAKSIAEADAEGLRRMAQLQVLARGFKGGFENLDLSETTALLAGPAISNAKKSSTLRKFKAVRIGDGDDSDVRAFRKKKTTRKLGA